ncbi:hypothetical protein LXL04_024463 [Taraxacum kok-saghyz]
MGNIGPLIRGYLTKLKQASVLWLEGFREACCLHRVIIYCLRSRQLMTRTGQCFLLNGLIFLGSVLILRSLIIPTLHWILPFEVSGGDQDACLPQMPIRLYAFFRLGLLQLIYALWFYPLYIFSFILSTIWYISFKALCNKFIFYEFVFCLLITMKLHKYGGIKSVPNQPNKSSSQNQVSPSSSNALVLSGTETSKKCDLTTTTSSQPKNLGDGTSSGKSISIISSHGTSEIPYGKNPSRWPRPAWHAPLKNYRVISGHLGWVRSIAFDPSNQWFCTRSADRTIKIAVCGFDQENMSIGQHDALLLFCTLCKGLLEDISHSFTKNFNIIDSVKAYLSYVLLRASVSQSPAIFQGKP